MSSDFSWADRFNIAVNTCLPCLRHSSSADSLNSPTANTHSGGWFPWSFFRRQPIQLPADDHDIHDPTSHSHHHANTAAAPSDPDSIHSLALVPEEENRIDQETRARRRGERKLARALAAQAAIDNEFFEGFQGSGQGVPLTTAGAGYVIDDDNNNDDDGDGDGADLDGTLYTRRRRSVSHFDSRSRTSTSTSKKTKSSKSSRDSTSIASPISPAFNLTLSHINNEQPTHIPPYTYSTTKDRSFPSTGFAVKTGTGSRDGAFLAHSGGRDDAFDGTF